MQAAGEERIRQIKRPLSAEMLAPLPAECRLIQFDSLPSERDLRRLAELLEDRPDVGLRAYGGYDGSITDLEFLRFFPTLTRFSAAALRYHRFTNIDGLRFLPNELEQLSLGQFRPQMSLQPLARFQALNTLYIEGPAKHTEVIAELHAVEDLTLRSVKLPDLSVLLPLGRLRSLDLKLGGTSDLALLSSLAPLAYLELWGIRGLDDLSPVADLPSLQFLFLQDLAGVTSLPDMSKMTSLRRIHIENLKRLTDLTPLRTAPSLEQLVLGNFPHLTAADFAFLADLSTLQSAHIWTGRAKTYAAVAEMIKLPRPPGAFEFR